MIDTYGLAGVAILALAIAITALIVRLIADDTAYVARHRPGTVRLRPDGWMPPTGARRIAALCDATQELPVVTP